MKKFVWLTAMISMLCLCAGCASKLVKIDSSPAFADIRINDEYVGKTPVYYRFCDRSYPWPIRKTSDYRVEADLVGYEKEIREYLETPVFKDISYVPDEIFFKMKPVIDKDIVK